MVIAGYVWHRFRAAPLRWLPGAAGIAIALAGFIVALTAPSIAGDVALRTELRALSGGDRLVSLVALQRQAESGDEVNQFATAQLHKRGFDSVLRQTSLRQLASPSGTVFRLVGADDLPSLVSLQSGRLPHQCNAQLCEGVIWARGSSPLDIALDPSLHLSIVGLVTRTDERLLNGTFAAGEGEVVIFVDGAASPSQIEALALIQRSNGWISEIDPHQITVASVPRLLRDLATLGSENNVADLTVTAPDKQLRSILRRAQITSRRLALPVGQAGTLLGGFAMLTTLAIRPWHRRGLRVLQLRAVSAWQERRFALFEAGLVAMIGMVLGVGLGIGAVTAIAAAANTPTGHAIARTTERGTVLAVVGLMLGYWAITVALLRSGRSQASSQRKILASDVIGLAAVAAWLIAAGRGETSSSSLASQSDPLLSITPALASIAAACVVVRVTPVAITVFRQFTPQRWWPTRLALGTTFGRGGRTLATVAFVASAITLATFALGYRSTLQTGSFDQAAFAVPLDFTITEGAALIRPQQILANASLSTSANGVMATDVVRRGLALRRTGTATETVEILGLDPNLLSQIRGWRADFGPQPTAAQLAVSVPRQASEDGVSIPPGSTQLTLSVLAAPANLGLAVVLERADGTWHEELAQPNGDGPSWVSAVEASDIWLRGFRVGESAMSTAQVLHNAGEGTGTDVAALAINIELGRILADTQPIAVDWATLQGREIQIRPLSAGANLTLVVHAGSSMALFGPSEQTPIPAVVDPLTASTAEDGLVTLETSGQGVVKLQVVGTANRFPTVGARFAVVDQFALSQQLNRALPGLGSANEAWLAADTSQGREQLRTQLADDQFRAVDVSEREAIEAQLSGNTLGRAVIVAFLWSSLIAAFLGAIAMIFLTQAERLDSTAVFSSLSADGATPRQLAAMLIVRAAVLMAIAIPIGVASGTILLHAVRQLVSVSANGTRPLPALRSVIEPWQITACVAAIALLAVGGAWIVARRTRSINRHDALSAQA